MAALTVTVMLTVSTQWEVIRVNAERASLEMESLSAQVSGSNHHYHQVFKTFICSYVPKFVISVYNINQNKLWQNDTVHKQTLLI